MLEIKSGKRITMNNAVNINVLERTQSPFVEKIEKTEKIEKKANMIQLAGIIEDSVVDGPGIRCVVFVQGCPHNCDGCHNEQAQDFTSGRFVDINKVAERLIKTKTTKITFSGGEPFCSAGELAQIADIVRRKKDIEIFTYTGYKYEELLEMAETDKGIYKLLCATNYLVDGKFEMEKKTLGSFYRGSSNQRIFDITCYPNSKKSRLIKTREELCL